MTKTYPKHDLMKLAIEEHLKCTEYRKRMANTPTELQH